MKTLVTFLLLFPAALFGQGIFIPARTVTGTVNGITRPVPGAAITVCAANKAGIPCSPALTNTVFQDSGLTVPLSNPFFSDANGNYPNVALAGGIYTVTESAPGFAGFSYQMTVSCAPGGVCAVTNFTAQSVNNVLWVGLGPGQYASVAAAVTAAGSVNKTIIALSSNFSGTCPAATLSSTNPNITVQDYSGTCSPSTPTASYFGTTYNFTDTNVYSLMRSQFGPTAFGGSNQALVTGYFLTAPINFNATGGNTMDGISAEADLFGTLTGTLANQQAAEHDTFVGTTGGAVTNDYAGIFYATSGSSSTTPITNMGGVRAIGCKAGSVLGAQPTNCYGLLAEDQGSIASGQNYSIKTKGKVDIGYTGNIPGSRLDFEDSTNTPHQTLIVDSSGLMNFQSPTATGIALEDNSGNIQSRTTASGTEFRANPIFPFVAGGLDLGKAANPWGNLWLGTAATNNFKFQPGTTTGARVITITDPVSPTTVGLPLTIASGTAVMTTASVAAVSGTTITCGSTVTVAATGVATTDTITFAPNAAPTSPNTGLIIQAWPTSGNVNFAYCNPTASALTPGAETLNWKVVR